MPKIVERDTSRAEEDGTILVRLDTGRVLFCLAERARHYALMSDADVVGEALQRMLDTRPDAFVEVHAPAWINPVPDVTIEAAGFTANLTPADRDRLRHITLGHWRQYFAQYPTMAQVDQLIDALGPEVAAKLVKAAVDGGKID